jgi:S-adenosylmethionine decarboxylase
MNIRTFGFVFENGQKPLLDDEPAVKDLLKSIVSLARLTPLEYTCHRFSPQGISATIILSESHIAVHTWPELGSGYITLTSCSQPDEDFMEATSRLIEDKMGATVVTTQELA